jgi:hypothetical protein
MKLAADHTICLPNYTSENITSYQNRNVLCAMNPTCRTFSRLFTAALYQVTHRAGSSHGKRDTCCCDCVHEASLSGVCNKQSNEHFTMQVKAIRYLKYMFTVKSLCVTHDMDFRCHL